MGVPSTLWDSFGLPSSLCQSQASRYLENLPGEPQLRGIAGAFAKVWNLKKIPERPRGSARPRLFQQDHPVRLCPGISAELSWQGVASRPGALSGHGAGAAVRASSSASSAPGPRPRPAAPARRRSCGQGQQQRQGRAGLLAQKLFAASQRIAANSVFTISNEESRLAVRKPRSRS